MGVAWVLLVVACDAVCSHPRASLLPWGFEQVVKERWSPSFGELRL